MKPAIFIDRDGVLVDESEYPIVRPEQVRLLPGVAHAVRRLNEKNWVVIVITNQAILARGLATEEQVAKVHERMNELLAEHGARIDGLYLCPHHPNPEQTTRVESLSIECECRKPNPGLLLRATKERNLNLAKSFFIGDSQSDVLAGQRAGVKTILLTDSGKGGRESDAKVTPDFFAGTLAEAVNLIVTMG